MLPDVPFNDICLRQQAAAASALAGQK